MHYFDNENGQRSFGWEWPQVITLAAGSPTATTITGFTGLTVNAYCGQMLRVLTGAQEGYKYWVISNTATVMTVQGKIAPNAGSPGPIEATARVAVTTHGIMPTTFNKWMGIFNGGSPPWPEPEIEEHYSIGARRRLTSSVTKIDYKSGKISLQMQSPELLCGLGEVWSEGTPKGGGGSTTLTSAVFGMDNQIDVASATNLSIGDLIEIAGGTHKEVRKITNIATLNLTLDAPLEYDHASTQAVVEVEAPLTVYVKQDSKRPLRSFTIVDTISDPDGVEGDNVFTFQGIYIGQADWKGAESKALMTDLALVGMQAQINPAGVTKPTVTPGTQQFFFWDEAELSIDSIMVAIPVSADLTWNNNLKVVRAIAGHKDKKPYTIECHKVSAKSTIKHNPVNTTLLQDSINPSELDALIKYARSTTDYVSFALENGRASAKFPWAEQDRRAAELSRLDESITLTIKIPTNAEYFC